jgi:hypothetical protein
MYRLSVYVYPGPHGTFVESFYGSDLNVSVKQSGVVMGSYNAGKVRKIK